jgi:hypothetical protein
VPGLENSIKRCVRAAFEERVVATARKRHHWAARLHATSGTPSRNAKDQSRLASLTMAPSQGDCCFRDIGAAKARLGSVASRPASGVTSPVTLIGGSKATVNDRMRRGSFRPQRMYGRKPDSAIYEY